MEDCPQEGVTVIWEDSRSLGNTWCQPSEVEDFHIIKCYTKGFIIRSNKHEILVGQTIGGDQFHNFIVIPKRSFIDIK